MYYRIETDGAESVYMKKVRGCNSHVELGMGIAWDVEKDEIDLPYEYKMTGAGEGDIQLHAWYPGSDLMKTSFVETLREAGVENLQMFPAEVRHAESGEQIPGLVTVNIVGRVSCAKVAESESEPLANVFYFKSLVIDPDRIQGLSMFRLDESPMVVLVNEQVAKAVREVADTGLVLTPVSESAGS